ncbi:MAG TPA: hemerythrin domain-containing protein [Bryobacteraceae bacterium]|jgi:hemerythrin-like domain-containing protein|nr:hemerythrin domain-containing protein [Bryobacteraceae bacterium]
MRLIDNRTAPNRRTWIGWSAALALGSQAVAQKRRRGEPEQAEEVSPAEDLMREHGVLKRALLIYREAIRRIDARQEVPPDAVAKTARLIRDFVENYHEKLEEDYLFPRFRKANQQVELVNILYTQHQKGRTLTDRILHLAAAAALKDAAQQQRLKEALHLFVRMYEPHEAREDTVLFPAFRKIVSKHEYDSLGEDFERKENQLFGGEGFEKNVEAVAAIEKQLGLYDLAQFTPSV